MKIVNLDFLQKFYAKDYSKKMDFLGTVKQLSIAFSDDATVARGYLGLDGIMVNDVTWKTSDFIEIPNKSSMIEYLLPKVINVGSLCFYDNAQTFISSIHGESTSLTSPLSGVVAIPSNAKYIKVTFANNSQYTYRDNQKVAFYQNGFLKNEEIYNIDSPNLTNGFLNGTIGNITTDANWKTTDYIPVDKGDALDAYLYVAVMSGLYGAMLCYYDEDKQLVSSPTPAYTDYNRTRYERRNYLIIPNGVKYIRATFSVANSGTYIKIRRVSVQELDYLQDQIDDLQDQIDAIEIPDKQYIYDFKQFPYSFKKINLIGDSISQGTQCTTEYDDCYASILRKMLNIEFGGKLNYGFVSAYADKTELKMTTTMLTMVSTTGWTLNAYGGTEGFGNAQYSSSTANAIYKMSLAKKFNYIKVAYVKGYTGTAKVSIYDNGVETDLLTIDSSNATKEPALSNIINISSYSASAQIWITLLTGTFVLNGFELITNQDWITFNNYSRAGASVQNIGGTLFDKETDCDLLIYAMGANNASNTLLSYLSALNETLATKTCNKLVVCPCCKTSTYDRYDSVEVMRGWAKTIGADFLSIYEILPKDTSGSAPYNTLSNVMYDHVHPNNKGHASIAEAIADKIKLSVKSKDLEELVYSKFELGY